MYKFGLLRTDGDNPEVHNASLLGPMTLGIEVTDSFLAARCCLGNIDPQHGNGPNPQSSAIEEALSYESLPPAGSTLVTIRPDRDSFGAMAIFLLRLLGREKCIRYNLVRAIGLIDSFGREEALRKLPTIVDWNRECAALKRVVINSGNRWPEISDRVEMIAKILTGEVTSQELDEVFSSDQPREENNLEVVRIPGLSNLVVLVKGSYYQAKGLGRRLAPIFIVFDPAFVREGIEGYKPHPKWGIELRQNSRSLLDVERLKKALNEAEAYARDTSVTKLESQGLIWGGPANLISSPQGKTSVLSEQDVVALVRANLRRR